MATMVFIVAPIPESMQKKAIRFINWLKDTHSIFWDGQGTVYVNGEEIPRSNIADLVGDIIHDRKSVKPPVGWQLFAQALRRLNVPRDFIGNSARWK